MSENKTEKTPTVIIGETVPATESPAPAPAPKPDGKFKTALKHPIATAKRHKTALALAAGTALGSVATHLLTKDGSEKPSDSVEELPPTDNVVSFPND